MNNSKRIYRAAIYVRLSKEDGDLDDVRKAESNSISNQKSLILNYLKDKEDIEIVSIREDDGYSGATFDRPAFKLMMQDVKDGIIDCIVVKDLSRFAREYIDAGRYIERMFPAMGIRFIAINDAYDSADTQAQGNEIIIPFKNLINDAYCRDISIKIRSHLETKRQNGEFVGNYCVYGYKKSEIDHNVIVPDEYAGHGKKYVYYMCSNNKKNKKCSSHRIKEADLESRVFDTLRDMTAILLDADEVIKEAGNSANFRIDQKKTKERVSAKEKEITKYNQMLVSLYEDYRDGIVDKSDFAIIKESFEVKRAEAEKAIDRLQKEAENIAAGIERDTEWLEEHRKWKTMPSLTRNVVVSLIQSVKVYEGGDIEIVLDCDDEYRKIVARAGELERQYDAERLVV